MPTDIDLNAPAWLAPAPRDEVLASVKRRARRIRRRRRVPTALALLAVLLLAAGAMTGGTPTSTRVTPISPPTTTAELGGAGGNSVASGTALGEDASAGRAAALEEARKATPHPVAVGARPDDSAPPGGADVLFGDAAGDADGRAVGCAGSTCADDRWVSSSVPSADLLSGSLRLESDVLTGTVHVRDLDRDFRTTHPEDSRETYAQSWGIVFRASESSTQTVKTEFQPWILMQAHRNLEKAEVTYSVTVSNGATHRAIIVDGSWSPPTDSVSVAAPAEEINKLLAELGSPDRIAPGTPIHRVTARASAWLGDTSASSERVIDEAARPSGQAFKL